MLPTAQERKIIAIAFKMLGTLYRVKPSDSSVDPFFHLLQTVALNDEWPLGEKKTLENIQALMLDSPRNKLLDTHWQRLFIGPNHLEAPPWGSVYLDKEQVIFGNSTVELGLFLKNSGISISTGINEPEDHIGLMFWYIAGLLENAHDEKLKTLLSNHLLPWSARYLELLTIHAQVPFFKGLSALAALSLQALESLFDVSAVERELFF